jgi:hypothetical protein
MLLAVLDHRFLICKLFLCNPFLNGSFESKLHACGTSVDSMMSLQCIQAQVSVKRMSSVRPEPARPQSNRRVKITLKESYFN